MGLIMFFVFVHISLFVPGYVVVKKTKLLSSRPWAEVCAGYVVTILFMGAVSLLGYMSGVPKIWPEVILFFALLISLGVFLKQKLWHGLAQFRFPLTCFVAISLFSLLFISLTSPLPYKRIPDPQRRPGFAYNSYNIKILDVAQTDANDNYLPYRQAQFIVNRNDPARDSFFDEWGVQFFQRTPLMGAVTASYFILLHEHLPIGYIWIPDSVDTGHTYQQFQVIASVLNALFILPAFFLLMKIFNKKAARVALLFIVPNAFFLYNDFFTWPKSMVAFFILLSWALILEKQLRFLIVAGIASGAAFITHDLAIFYICSSVLLLLYYKRFRDAILFCGINLLFWMPWFIASNIIYKKPSTFFLYPFKMDGLPQSAEDSPAIFDKFFHTSPLKIISIRLGNLLYTFSPYQLLFSEGGHELSRRLWSFTLFNLPGAIGAGTAIASVLGAIKKIRDLPFWIMAVAPVLICVLLTGTPKLLGALHYAEASVVMLIGLGAWYLVKFRSNKWLMTAFYANIVQSIFFMAYSYDFRLGIWFKNPSDIVRLLIIFLIVYTCKRQLNKIRTASA